MIPVVTRHQPPAAGVRLSLATTRQPEVYLFFVALDFFTVDFVVQEQSVQNPGADFGNVFFFKTSVPVSTVRITPRTLDSKCIARLCESEGGRPRLRQPPPNYLHRQQETADFHLAPS